MNACKALYGAELEQADIDSINSAIRFLGYTEAEILRVLSKAKRFYRLNNCRYSRKNGDRLRARVVLKNNRTIKAFLNYEPAKEKTL